MQRREKVNSPCDLRQLSGHNCLWDHNPAITLMRYPFSNNLPETITLKQQQLTLMKWSSRASFPGDNDDATQFTISLFILSCQVSYLGISHDHPTVAATGLFSPSEQTRYAQVVCGSERVTVAFHGGSLLFLSLLLLLLPFVIYSYKNVPS